MMQRVQPYYFYSGNFVKDRSGMFLVGQRNVMKSLLLFFQQLSGLGLWSIQGMGEKLQGIRDGYTVSSRPVFLRLTI